MRDLLFKEGLAIQAETRSEVLMHNLVLDEDRSFPCHLS